ncbi:uncharacterized protein LOC106082803 [Stomoxys calcitrans]|uniref:uncharacterized protein LOC106082803 n=1 Tax=Stomoxys calcitrans TaxID=35570 RepID=UPI0027E23D43|nr:uncharacterized protein LOC106082803 [Stomoxys calcitrans]
MSQEFDIFKNLDSLRNTNLLDKLKTLETANNSNGDAANDSLNDDFDLDTFLNNNNTDKGSPSKRVKKNGAQANAKASAKTKTTPKKKTQRRSSTTFSDISLPPTKTSTKSKNVPAAVEVVNNVDIPKKTRRRRRDTWSPTEYLLKNKIIDPTENAEGKKKTRSRRRSSSTEEMLENLDLPAMPSILESSRKNNLASALSQMGNVGDLNLASMPTRSDFCAIRRMAEDQAARAAAAEKAELANAKKTPAGSLQNTASGRDRIDRECIAAAIRRAERGNAKKPSAAKSQKKAPTSRQEKPKGRGRSRTRGQGQTRGRKIKRNSFIVDNSPHNSLSSVFNSSSASSSSSDGNNSSVVQSESELEPEHEPESQPEPAVANAPSIMERFLEQARGRGARGRGRGRGRGQINSRSRRSNVAEIAARLPQVDFIDLVSSPAPRVEGLITLDSDDEQDMPRTRARRVSAKNKSQKTDSETKSPSLDISLDDDNPEVSVKIKWKGKPEAFKLRKYQKFSIIFQQLAEREGTNMESMVFNLDDRIVTADDTPDSIDYKIFQFINGRVLSSILDSPGGLTSGRAKKPRNPNEISVKVQSDKWKRPLQIDLLKTDKFRILYIKCSEELKVGIEQLKLSFDGELLELNDTPADLDLEGGEVIDLRLRE